MKTAVHHSLALRTAPCPHIAVDELRVNCHADRVCLRAGMRSGPSEAGFNYEVRAVLNHRRGPGLT